MTVETTPSFWDCECQTNYIHPKIEIKCDSCRVFSTDQPDSRVVEVEAMRNDNRQRKDMFVVNASTDGNQWVMVVPAHSPAQAAAHVEHSLGISGKYLTSIRRQWAQAGVVTVVSVEKEEYV